MVVESKPFGAKTSYLLECFADPGGLEPQTLPWQGSTLANYATESKFAVIEGFEPSFLWGDNPNPTRQLSTYDRLRSWQELNLQPPSRTRAFTPWMIYIPINYKTIGRCWWESNPPDVLRDRQTDTTKHPPAPKISNMSNNLFSKKQKNPTYFEGVGFFF